MSIYLHSERILIIIVLSVCVCVCVCVCFDTLRMTFHAVSCSEVEVLSVSICRGHILLKWLKFVHDYVLLIWGTVPYLECVSEWTDMF
jgi:hypothetical protein